MFLWHLLLDSNLGRHHPDHRSIYVLLFLFDTGLQQGIASVESPRSLPPFPQHTQVCFLVVGLFVASSQRAGRSEKRLAHDPSGAILPKKLRWPPKIPQKEYFFARNRLAVSDHNKNPGFGIKSRPKHRATHEKGGRGPEFKGERRGWRMDVMFYCCELAG